VIAGKKSAVVLTEYGNAEPSHLPTPKVVGHQS